MENNFQFIALDKEEFEPLFNLDEVELTAKGIKKMTVDEYPGFPCRVSLADAELGEEVVLLHYEHHSAHSPYRSSGPIFVRKTAMTAMLKVNEVPKMLAHRLLSIRGFDNQSMMIFAEVTQGENLKAQLFEIFKDKNIEYLNIHNAKPGCYNCLVKRA